LRPLQRPDQLPTQNHVGIVTSVAGPALDDRLGLNCGRGNGNRNRLNACCANCAGVTTGANPGAGAPFGTHTIRTVPSLHDCV
jgi:hypothetical protein